MKLGMAIEYAGRGLDIPIERIQRCEELGYDSERIAGLTAEGVVG